MYCKKAIVTLYICNFIILYRNCKKLIILEHTSDGTTMVPFLPQIFFVANPMVSKYYLNMFLVISRRIEIETMTSSKTTWYPCLCFNVCNYHVTVLVPFSSIAFLFIVWKESGVLKRVPWRYFECMQVKMLNYYMNFQIFLHEL